jgi:hypothetical protein
MGSREPRRPLGTSTGVTPVPDHGDIDLAGRRPGELQGNPRLNPKVAPGRDVTVVVHNSGGAIRALPPAF